MRLWFTGPKKGSGDAMAPKDPKSRSGDADLNILKEPKLKKESDRRLLREAERTRRVVAEKKQREQARAIMQKRRAYDAANGAGAGAGQLTFTAAF